MHSRAVGWWRERLSRCAQGIPQSTATVRSRVKWSHGSAGACCRPSTTFTAGVPTSARRLLILLAGPRTKCDPCSETIDRHQHAGCAALRTKAGAGGDEVTAVRHVHISCVKQAAGIDPGCSAARCEACEEPSAAEAEMIGLACPACGGAVVPATACAAGVVTRSELPAGSGSGLCSRHAKHP